MMNIGIDIDGVLADLTTPTLDLYNQKFRTSLTKQDMISWDYLPKLGKIDRKEQTKLFNQCWNQDLVKLEEPEVGQILYHLRKLRHKITIISHRDPPTIPAVVSWLERNWLKYDNLIFLSHNQNKLKYVDILIDDHPFTAQKAGEFPEASFYLRTQPWNKDIDLSNYPRNVWRIHSLSEILDLVRRLSKRK